MRRGVEPGGEERTRHERLAEARERGRAELAAERESGAECRGRGRTKRRNKHLINYRPRGKG